MLPCTYSIANRSYMGSFLFSSFPFLFCHFSVDFLRQNWHYSKLFLVMFLPSSPFFPPFAIVSARARTADHMDTVYGYPLMDSYDMFYTDNGPLDSINDAVNLPYEIDEKDHLIACHGSEQRPNFQSVLDYTPDLIPNGTPEDDPLASFDDLYVPLTSPHISSYLRYLKEPCTSVYSGGDGTTAVDLSGCFFNDQSSLLPDYYRGFAPVDNSAQLQYPGLFAETMPFEDWLHDAPADMPDNTELFSTSIEGGGMTREYVSLSVSLVLFLFKHTHI